LQLGFTVAGVLHSPPCGRFTNQITWHELVRRYRIHDRQPAQNLRPRYNVAPTQEIPIC